jgi:pimeloyl-ACP methyl ester carboxylesterase
MAIDVTMPKWGLTMQEGYIGQWLKIEGDLIEEGEPLVEVETEKMTGVVEAPASGVLARILSPAGQDVPITQVIAIITAPGESAPEVAVPKETTAESLAPSTSTEAVAKTTVSPPSLPAGNTGAPVRPKGSIRVMPIARRMAKAHGLDLATIQGSGPKGTITKRDVEKVLAGSTIQPLQKVTFFSEGYRLDGLLYTPADLAPDQKCPAVILCVGYTYLKGMVMPDIAKVLNRAGYAALLFDYRGFGDSEGPRWRLIPQEQVNDVRAALTFAADQPHLDPNRLAVLGISLGGSNAITAGALDKRASAVIAIQPTGDGARWLRGLRRYSEWVDFQKRLAADRSRRVHSGQSEPVDPLEIVLPDPESQAFLETVWQEFPQMKCELPLETAERLIEYSPETLIERIAPRPVLLIHGDNDCLVPIDETHSLFARAGEPRQIAVLSGGGHFDWVMPNSPGFKYVTDRVIAFLQGVWPPPE